VRRLFLYASAHQDRAEIVHVGAGRPGREQVAQVLPAMEVLDRIERGFQS